VEMINSNKLVGSKLWSNFRVQRLIIMGSLFLIRTVENQIEQYNLVVNRTDEIKIQFSDIFYKFGSFSISSIY